MADEPRAELPLADHLQETQEALESQAAAEESRNLIGNDPPAVSQSAPVPVEEPKKPKKQKAPPAKVTALKLVTAPTPAGKFEPPEIDGYFWKPERNGNFSLYRWFGYKKSSTGKSRNRHIQYVRHYTPDRIQREFGKRAAA